MVWLVGPGLADDVVEGRAVPVIGMQVRVDWLSAELADPSVSFVHPEPDLAAHWCRSMVGVLDSEFLAVLLSVACCILSRLPVVFDALTVSCPAYVLSFGRPGYEQARAVSAFEYPYSASRCIL